MKSVVHPLVLILALAASGAIAAEDMYRSTMPDGSIRYGEAPDPGAKSIKKVPAPPSATGVTVVTPEERMRQIPLQQGGVSVVPQQPRLPNPPAEQGKLHAPSDLPKRNY